MRIRNALYFFAVVFAILCNNGGTFCKEIDIPSEPEQLRLFLLKGYTANFDLKRNIFIRSITPHGVSDSSNICEVYYLIKPLLCQSLLR